MSDSKEKTIRLADPLFYTIQGEGFSAGRPALFIRVQGCTVGCDYCDTKYSWPDPDGLNRGVSVPHESVRGILDQLPSTAVVVVTGGEPFEHVRSLRGLLWTIDDGTREFEVETSGYIFDPWLAAAFDRIILSPKILPSSAVTPTKQMTQETATRWLRYELSRPGIVSWKFVVRDDEDLDHLLPVIEEWGIPENQVYLMPEGLTADPVLERGRWLAEVCKKHGFRLSLRQHVLLWGPKRGV